MKTVTIFSTPTCGFCKALKDFLKSRNIPYEEKDVTSDPKNLEEMQRYAPGVMSVPVTIFNKDQPDQEVQVGFDEMAVSKTLSL